MFAETDLASAGVAIPTTEDTYLADWARQVLGANGDGAFDNVVFVATLDRRGRNGGFNHYPVKSVDAFVREVRKHDAIPHLDVYAALGQYKKERYQGANGGWHYREQDNVIGASSFWLDIDAGPKKYEKDPKRSYPTIKAALQALKAWLQAVSLPEPNVIVQSGNGLHVYWTPGRFIPKDEWQKAAKTLKALCKGDSGRGELKADPSRTDEIASILRPPTTRNRKDPNNPLPVKLLNRKDNAGDFIARLENAKSGSKENLGEAGGVPANNSEFSAGVGDESWRWRDLSPEQRAVKLPEIAAALQYLAKLGHSRERDDWYAVGLNLREMGDVGLNLFLKYSADGYDGFDADKETAWFWDQNSTSSAQSVCKKANELGFRWVAGQGKEANPVSLVEVSLDDLESATIEAPSFIVSDIIPRGFLTMIAGDGGSGKSVLALTIGSHVACGKTWGPLQCRQGRVLVVSMEDAGSLVRFRLAKIIRSYRLDASSVAANMTVIDGTDADALYSEENISGVRKLVATGYMDQIAERAKGYDLVIVDNASDAYNGNENDRRQVRTFIKGLARMVKDHNGAVLLIAHLDKSAVRNGSNGSTYSGSTAWNNSARSRLALVNDPKAGPTLRQEKLNVGRCRPDIELAWDGLGVLVPGAGTCAADRAGRESADDTAVLDALRSLIAVGESVGTAATGPNPTHKRLRMLPALADVPADRVQAAIDRLATQRVIFREPYKNADHKTKERWAIQADSANPPISAE